MPTVSGAISLSPATGATGWSHDYSTRWEAEEVAQSHCYKNAGDCRVAIWFKNGCGAVARGPDGWGANWAAGKPPRTTRGTGLLCEPFRQLPDHPLAMLRRKLIAQSSHPCRITNGARRPGSMAPVE
ncbi:DUF4189 domain-containing protein [Rhizobium sp. RCAM05350]|nr:DUF4189 domain-containing protein [Rhizobium sp. RCAM05350]